MFRSSITSSSIHFSGRRNSTRAECWYLSHRFQSVGRTAIVRSMASLRMSKMDNLCKPLASAHGPQIVSVLICIELTVVLHFRVVPKIQRHTAKPILLLIQISSSQFLLRNDFNMPHIFVFIFTVPIGFLLVPPSLAIVIEFKYIHFYVAFSKTGIEVEAMQNPYVGTMFSFFNDSKNRNG